MINIIREKHFLSSITDLIMTPLAISLFLLPNILYHIIYYDTVNRKTHEVPPVLFYIMNFGLCLFYCKDCIGAQSIGKRVYKLQVYTTKTDNPAGPLRCLLRNLMLILLPIEIAMILIYPSRRLGDILAGTKLSVKADVEKDTSLNYLQVITSVVISYFFMLFTYSWWFCR